MGKNTSQFVCQNCGAKYSKWAGHCNNCDAWNSIIEDLVVSEASGKNAISQAKTSGQLLKFTKINEITITSDKERLKTEFPGLNEVLGGGILRGSVTLLAGQPGIGKSTILMQICAEVAIKHQVLYVSGEESASQANCGPLVSVQILISWSLPALPLVMISPRLSVKVTLI